MEEDKTILIIECDECGFAAKLIHALDDESYTVNYCPVCKDDDILVEYGEEQILEENNDE